MKKVGVLCLFAIIIGCVLFMQWDSFSKLDKSANQGEHASQHISITSEKGNLKVKQTITELTTKQRYKVLIPDQAKDWKCINGYGEACETKWNHPDVVIAEDSKLILQYSIPLPSGDAFLIDDWVTAFPEVEMTGTEVEIVDSLRRQGMWVTGLPLKGAVEKDLIDFYYFEGQHTSPAIYWQAEPLQKNSHISGNIDLYTKGETEFFQQLSPNIEELKGYPYTSIILTDRIEATSANGLMILSQKTTPDNLLKKTIDRYFSLKFTETSQYWLVDFFSALVIGAVPSSGNAQRVHEEFQKKLTDKEMEAFIDAVLEMEGIFSPVNLDKALSNIKREETNFFVKSVEKQQPIELFFFDERDVLILGNHYEDIKMINQDGKKLFPFKETMEKFGYNVKQISEEEIFLKKDDETYRFYLNELIFIKNDEKYGVLQNPLTVLNNRIFIEKKWLQNIFNLKIEETSSEVFLSY